MIPTITSVKCNNTWRMAGDEDIEEFPLLLQSGDVSDLIETARRQGLCAAGLARLVIHDYLIRVRRNLVKPVDGSQRVFVGGSGR